MTHSKTLKTQLPETVIEGKRLGRHIHHDSRSRDFPARQAQQVTDATHRSAGLPLDQGEHRCGTAHALCGALGSDTGRSITEETAIRIYKTAIDMDGGEPDPSQEAGSSGLMACKAAARLGLISSYEHAFGIEHALRALVLRPVMTGVSWYSSFDSPDPDSGLVEIAPGAKIRGGHEVLAHAIDAKSERVWFWNSWGPEYGHHGRFCMSFDTWNRLLQDRGDVTVPIA